MNNKQLEAYRTLKDANVEVSKHNQIKFNGGSETVKHLVCKSLAAYVGHANGYRVSSEVEVPQGEIDICLWGHPSRLSYAVEVETSPSKDTIESKLDRYVKATPIDELVIINPGVVPLDMVQAAEFIADELGVTI